MGLQTRTVTFPTIDTIIPAYLAIPSGAGPYPTVVVLQEIFGVNAHIQQVSERLAREGYVAIAPHLYHRQVQNFAVGYTAADVALGRKYKANTQADDLLSDIQASIDYAQGLPQSKPGGAGVIGFCFGGHVAYLAATLPEVAATAAFYGAGIVTSTFGQGEPTLARTPEITGKLYGFFGKDDDLIPNREVDQIKQALHQAQVDHQIFHYDGAGHGFFCDQRESYRPAAAADAWENVKVLFQSTL